MICDWRQLHQLIQLYNVKSTHWSFFGSRKRCQYLWDQVFRGQIFHDMFQSFDRAFLQRVNQVLDSLKDLNFLVMKILKFPASISKRRDRQVLFRSWSNFKWQNLSSCSYSFRKTVPIRCQLVLKLPVVLQDSTRQDWEQLWVIE